MTSAPTQTDSDTHEGRSPSQRAMSPPARQILLLLAVSLQLNFDLAVIPVSYALSKGSEFPVILLSGFLLGQISVLAQYLAWGTERSVFRGLKSCSLVILIWAAITLGTLSCQDSFEIGSIEAFLAVVVVASCLFVSIPYWGIRAICRLRLEALPFDPRTALAPWPHSRLLERFTWSAVATLLVVVLQSKITREVWKHLNRDSGGDWIGLSLWITLWATLCALLAIPAAWAWLNTSEFARRIRRFGIYAVILVGAECAVIHAFGFHLRGSLWMIILNLGILSEVIAWAVFLRFCGYRIQF